jgi:hypothetical protein
MHDALGSRTVIGAGCTAIGISDVAHGGIAPRPAPLRGVWSQLRSDRGGCAAQPAVA